MTTFEAALEYIRNDGLSSQKYVNVYVNGKSKSMLKRSIFSLVLLNKHLVSNISHRNIPVTKRIRLPSIVVRRRPEFFLTALSLLLLIIQFSLVA